MWIECRPVFLGVFELIYTTNSGFTYNKYDICQLSKSTICNSFLCCEYVHILYIL